MTSRTVVSHVQEALSENRHIDGWLFYDYRGRNRAVLDLLGVPQSACLTRRFFYWVPAVGEPIKIIHFVDEPLAEYFTGKTIFYSSWRELEAVMLSLLNRGQTVAMEYWPSELLPSQSILDAGTKEWFERQGVHIISSWPLLSSLVGHLTPIQKDHYRDAVQVLGKAFEHSWEWLKQRLSTGNQVTEKNLQEMLINVIHDEKATFDHPPIVAVGKNSSIPHHISGEVPICPDAIVLIDAWCKMNDLNAPYADFSQVAFTGRKPPEIAQKIFQVVREAQETAIRFIDVCLQNGCAIPGAEVDMACRYVIDSHGFGDFFTHRTGHNIFLEVHGPGANLDTYETRDARHLITDGCYSVEPGIYLPNTFGIRLECNVLLDSKTSCSVFEKAPDTIRCIY
jgi:Xaa-Pro dipeptidase